MKYYILYERKKYKMVKKKTKPTFSMGDKYLFMLP